MRQAAGGQVPYTRYPAMVTGCQPNGDSNGPCATPEQVSGPDRFPMHKRRDLRAAARATGTLPRAP
jgi:hypothetical protein